MNRQETQLLLTNRVRHWCKCDGVADLLKHAAPHLISSWPWRIRSFCV